MMNNAGRSFAKCHSHTKWERVMSHSRASIIYQGVGFPLGGLAGQQDYQMHHEHLS